MAVIDTSIDKPKSCIDCPSYQGVNGCCDKGCFLPYSLFDNGDAVPQDCPLKSTDTLLQEIKILDIYDCRYISRKEVLSIIHKYCDIKERKNEDIGIR